MAVTSKEIARSAGPAEPDGTTAVAAPDRRPAADGGRTSRWADRRPVLLGAVGCAAAIAIWGLVSALGLVSDQSLPGPWAVADALAGLLADGDFLRAVGDTVLAWVVSLAVATAIAVPLGLLIGSVPFLQPPTTGIVHALRSVPATALIPVAILVFGLGFQMKVVLVVFAIVLPILLNTLYGVRAAEPAMKRVARSLRWAWWQTAWRLTLPAALPSIASGVRVAGGIGLVVTVSTELLGARSGLGTVIRTYQQSELPAEVYAGIIVAGILGIVLGALLRTAERTLIPWAPQNRTMR